MTGLMQKKVKGKVDLNEVIYQHAQRSDSTAEVSFESGAPPVDMFVPSNESERFDRHTTQKISSYAEFRNQMKEQSEKYTAQSISNPEFIKQLEEIQEKVEKNTEAIERMGALGVFETSQRVRESISWNRAKRFQGIVGEKVDPEEVALGGYGSKYAMPVQDFNQLLWDDLVSFRNKFLQFLANPDNQVKEFMPSLQDQTKLALRDALLRENEEKQRKITEIIALRE